MNDNWDAGCCRPGMVLRLKLKGLASSSPGLASRLPRVGSGFLFWHHRWLLVQSSFADEQTAIFRAHGLPFAEARDLAAATITESVKDDIGGDEQIVLTQQSRWYDMSCKAILLPVWYMNYRHGDKVYKIAVNAITGEVQGERPWSAWKIAAAIIFGLIVIALIIGGVSMLQQH